MKRTPLKRKTPLRAKTSLRAYSSLKRTGFKKPDINAPRQKKKVYRLKSVSEQGIPSAEADKKLSKFIIARDKKCLKCGSDKNLTCSHFHIRKHTATRWDPENLDTLCVSCHQEWEKQTKPGQSYHTWKRARMGVEAFEALAKKAQTIVKRSDVVAEVLSQF